MAAFPPPPVNTIDWSNVGFKVREVNGHMESTFSQATGQWTPLKFVADPYMRIHGMSPALNYGQQAYEGLKAFRLPGDSRLSLFRPDRNALRLQHSADVASMPRVPVDMFVRACRATVALNAGFVPPHETGAALYVRPQLYGSSAQLGLTAPEEYTFCVFVVPTGVYHGTSPVKALVLDEFDRTAPKGTGNAKVGGNYAPVLRWSDKARRQGYGITLHLDSARHEDIDEFSTSGFIGVVAKDGAEGSDVKIVVPDSDCVIDSVTSDSVQHMARAWGWTVEKRAVKYAELPDFTEVMAAGTAAALVPIRSVTRLVKGGLPTGAANVTTDDESETVTYIAADKDEAGPVCIKVLTQLKAIQLGKVEDEFGWRCEVGVQDLKVEGAPVSGQETPRTVDQMD
ncbi:branched-chain-amino-acid aminotransferase 5 [Cordyceps fumosorosea ARSEF 2679]|uniref:Branched-chain-amino-acid aminotransferase 5 n=1 Tax=Cordyceps fumosorosea (strain ARSEF 2679) TaxID=1081104 RepID=A0A167STP8_CORFA|nr:branched-chain-amino-acid aminotransferase 5 [Cordyceps fumosorosea ARSEF 2679]OAA59916.1 branched-chain-amino-acid aminotransferase 5 [Cordyceps fumosorosea ARSEF 2679]